MGRLYECDYCLRSFQDSAFNRKKHLKSLQHLNAKRNYELKNQNSFQTLKLELEKSPCLHFYKYNSCKFGDNCIHSHLTQHSFEELKNKVLFENFQQISRNSSQIDNNFDPKSHLEIWLKNTFTENNSREKSSDLTISSNNSFNIKHFYNIFSHLTPQQIPISLIPPNIQDFNECEDCDWG